MTDLNFIPLEAKDIKKAIEALKKNGVEQNDCQVVLDANTVYQIMLENERLRRKPDPATGLMKCGCGGKVAIAKYPGFLDTPDLYQVDCFECFVGTKPTMSPERARIAWNTAMGYTDTTQEQ